MEKMFFCVQMSDTWQRIFSSIGGIFLVEETTYKEHFQRVVQTLFLRGEPVEIRSKDCLEEL